MQLTVRSRRVFAVAWVRPRQWLDPQKASQSDAAACNWMLCSNQSYQHLILKVLVVYFKTSTGQEINSWTISRACKAVFYSWHVAAARIFCFSLETAKKMGAIQFYGGFLNVRDCGGSRRLNTPSVMKMMFANHIRCRGRPFEQKQLACEAWHAAFCHVYADFRLIDNKSKKAFWSVWLGNAGCIVHKAACFPALHQTLQV